MELRPSSQECVLQAYWDVSMAHCASRQGHISSPTQACGPQRPTLSYRCDGCGSHGERYDVSSIAWVLLLHGDFATIASAFLHDYFSYYKGSSFTGFFQLRARFFYKAEPCNTSTACALGVKVLRACGSYYKCLVRGLSSQLLTRAVSHWRAAGSSRWPISFSRAGRSRGGSLNNGSSRLPWSRWAAIQVRNR